MNISTKGRYGLRAMLDIAMHCGERPVTLSAISARQTISEGYLEQLMLPLKREKLVQSVRGAQGGYMLSRPASEISVGEVFRALEGPLSITSCASNDEFAGCGMEESCLVRDLWQQIQESVSRIIDSHTLADLLPHPPE